MLSWCYFRCTEMSFLFSCTQPVKRCSACSVHGGYDLLLCESSFFLSVSVGVFAQVDDNWRAISCRLSFAPTGCSGQCLWMFQVPNVFHCQARGWRRLSLLSVFSLIFLLIIPSPAYHWPRHLFACTTSWQSEREDSFGLQLSLCLSLSRCVTCGASFGH